MSCACAVDTIHSNCMPLSIADAILRRFIAEYTVQTVLHASDSLCIIDEQSQKP